MTEWDGRSYTEQMGSAPVAPPQRTELAKERKTEPKTEMVTEAVAEPVGALETRPVPHKKKRRVRWSRVFLYLLLLAAIAIGVGVYLAVWFMGDLYRGVDQVTGVQTETLTVMEILKALPSHLGRILDNLLKG